MESAGIILCHFALWKARAAYLLVALGFSTVGVRLLVLGVGCWDMLGGRVGGQLGQGQMTGWACVREVILEVLRQATYRFVVALPSVLGCSIST